MYFEKIASDSQLLADEIIKVASEEINGMEPQDVYNEMISELAEAGYDTTGVTPENVDWQEVYNYGVEKTAEFIAEDIVKVASGASVNYETNAASKAVAPFLENDGVANFGSAFGAGNGPIGSVVHAGIDKNVFGGWGTLIGKPAFAENAVSAAGKVPGLLGSTNMKLASEDPNERMEAFREVLAKTAEDEGQSLDEYIFDLGMEALVNEIKEESIPEGKVAEWLSPDLTFYEQKRKESEVTKLASDQAFANVEEYAAENEVDPVDVVLEYGVEKAAEYIEEFMKEAAKGGKSTAMLKNMKKSVGKAGKTVSNFASKGVKSLDKGVSGAGKGIGKWISKHPKTSIGIGAGAAAAGGAGLYAALKKKKEENKEASAEVENTNTETNTTDAILKLAQEKLGLVKK
jgi:hypothetical protein